MPPNPNTIDDVLAGVADESTLEDSLITLYKNALANMGSPRTRSMRRSRRYRRTSRS